MAPRKVYPPVPPEEQRTLRPGRASTPAVPSTPRAKRTSAQVLEDKRHIEEEKKKKLAKRQAAILSISEKENEMAQADKAANLFTDHPPANAKKKILWPHPQMAGEFSSALLSTEFLTYLQQAQNNPE
jgi:hypothetical protein